MKLKLFFCFLIATGILEAQTFVNVNATGLEDGSSWADAYTSLSDALADANATDIWIAQGTYLPGSVKTSTFTLTNNKRLFGGFAGAETMLSQRDFKTNKTILSGDLLENDANTSFNFSDSSISDNIYHVLTITGVNVVMDGITISGGNANGVAADATDRGAAIFLNNATANGFTIRNTIIENNVTTNVGTVYVIPNHTGENSIEYYNVIFRNNLAKNSPIFYASMQTTNRSLTTTFTNCLIHNNFVKNTSGNNGVNYLSWIRSERAGSKQKLVVTNTTVANNTLSGSASIREKSIFSMSRVTNSGNNVGITLYNNIFWNNSINTKVLGNHFDNLPYVQGIASNNIDEDLLSTISVKNLTLNKNPKFIDATNHNFRLQDDSFAQGLGDNSFISNGNTEDLDNNPRIHLTTVDLGAYENQTATSTATIVIQDVNLKNYFLNTANADTNNNGEIEISEALGFNSAVVLNNINVTDLTGLEFFLNITKFTSVNNPLSSLVDLSENKKVTEIVIRNSNMQNIVLPETNVTTKIDLRNNKLESLNITKLTGITDFNVKDNVLTFLNLKNGNNENFTNFESRNNPNLTCIAVDNISYAINNFIFIDKNTSFSNECALSKVFVNLEANGNNDGSSWANAYTSLKGALTDFSGATFWIAKGVYKPGSAKGDRFTITKDQKIYGGFVGTEVNLADRDFRNNKTIISGDLNDNDNDGLDYNATYDDNSNNLLVANGDNILIDGLLVTGGNGSQGSALTIAVDTQNITVKNTTFEFNKANNGIIYAEPRERRDFQANEDYDYIFENCTFSKNTARLATILYVSSPQLSNFKLRTHFINSLFNSNQVLDRGNDVGENVLFWFRTDITHQQTAKFTNATFVSNRFYGTGTQGRSVIAASRINTVARRGKVNVEVYNSIFWDNIDINGVARAALSGFGTQVGPNSVTVQNSLSPLDFANINANTKLNNKSLDPLFANSFTYTLQNNSPAVNSGDSSKVPNNITLDLAGNARIQASAVDMGCYESSSTLSVTDTFIDNEALQFYPNPASSFLNIKMNNLTLDTVEVFSILGKRVMHTQSNIIDVNGLSKGMYIVKITTENSKVFAKRFIKK